MRTVDGRGSSCISGRGFSEGFESAVVGVFNRIPESKECARWRESVIITGSGACKIMLEFDASNSE